MVESTGNPWMRGNGWWGWHSQIGYFHKLPPARGVDLKDKKMSFLGGSMVNNLPAKAGDAGEVSSVPGSGRSGGGGNGNPLQYTCLKIPWTGEPAWPQSMGCRVSHDWTCTQKYGLSSGALLGHFEMTAVSCVNDKGSWDLVGVKRIEKLKAIEVIK